MASTRLRLKLVTSFLTSLVAGFVTAQRSNGKDRVKRKLLASVAGAAGLVVGYTLAERLTGSATETESGIET
jgi:hypothetical protein